MACLSPILIKDPRNLWISGAPAYMQVPCGKCIGCLKKKQMDWSIRVSEQINSAPCSCFVTLTYRDDTVPWCAEPQTGDHPRMILRKKDYQDWIKRLRRDLEYKGFTYPITYFVCGEYGTRTFRPHYHVVVIGANVEAIRRSLEDWADRFGYYNAQDIGRTSIDRSSVGLYVGKYASKGVYSSESPLMADYMEPPFIQTSHKLGLKYMDDRLDYFSLMSEHTKYNSFDDFVQDFVQNFRYRSGTFNLALPRYYKDYFFKKMDLSGFPESVLEKTGYSVLDYKPNFQIKENKVNGKLQAPKAICIPSIRDQIALSVLRQSDADIIKRVKSSEGASFAEVVAQMASEERSNNHAFLQSKTRELNSTYFRSKV